MVINRAPMGFNTWNTFGSKINEDLLKEIADALVSTGLSELGYKYVVIDDCWALKQTANWLLIPKNSRAV